MNHHDLYLYHQNRGWGSTWAALLTHRHLPPILYGGHTPTRTPHRIALVALGTLAPLLHSTRVTLHGPNPFPVPTTPSDPTPTALKAALERNGVALEPYPTSTTHRFKLKRFADRLAAQAPPPHPAPRTATPEPTPGTHTTITLTTDASTMPSGIGAGLAWHWDTEMGTGGYGMARQTNTRDSTTAETYAVLRGVQALPQQPKPTALHLITDCQGVLHAYQNPKPHEAALIALIRDAARERNLLLYPTWTARHTTPEQRNVDAKAREARYAPAIMCYHDL